MPALLDLYCGAGGASMGYARAGFDVVGVDINPQPNYPFRFIQDDALTYLETLTKRKRLRFSMIHASPPCQKFSNLTIGTNGNPYEHPDFIAKTRKLMLQLGLPAVIENVPGAPLYGTRVMLCGEMFRLRVIRHRTFELSKPIRQPRHKLHRGRVIGINHGKRTVRGYYVGVHGHGNGNGTGEQIVLDLWSRAMGIDWMTKKELAEAIPPAYTEYVGRRF